MFVKKHIFVLPDFYFSEFSMHFNMIYIVRKLIILKFLFDIQYIFHNTDSIRVIKSL